MLSEWQRALSTYYLHLALRPSPLISAAISEAVAPYCWADSMPGKYQINTTWTQPGKGIGHQMVKADKPQFTGHWVCLESGPQGSTGSVSAPYVRYSYWGLVEPSIRDDSLVIDQYLISDLIASPTDQLWSSSHHC